jgi:hypothetical protein
LPIKLVIRDGRGDRTTVLVGEDGAATITDEDTQNGVIPGVRCIGDILIRVADGEITFARAVHENLIRVELGAGPGQERPERPHRILAALAALIRADS